MKHMFQGCERLTNLNLSNFNTKNVKDMNSMFEYCYELTSLNVNFMNNDFNFVWSICELMNKISYKIFLLLSKIGSYFRRLKI